MRCYPNLWSVCEKYNSSVKARYLLTKPTMLYHICCESLLDILHKIVMANIKYITKYALIDPIRVDDIHKTRLGMCLSYVSPHIDIGKKQHRILSPRNSRHNVCRQFHMNSHTTNPQTCFGHEIYVRIFNNSNAASIHI